MSYAKIRPRRGTLYQWSTINPILGEGELVVEYPESGMGSGFCRLKLGDGIQRYNDLGYAFDGATANEIVGGGVEASHLISIRSGTSDEWELNNPVLEAGELGYDSTVRSVKVGDGFTEWNKLNYIVASELMTNITDFGDEDDDGTSSEDNLFNQVIDNSKYS